MATFNKLIPEVKRNRFTHLIICISINQSHVVANPLLVNMSMLTKSVSKVFENANDKQIDYLFILLLMVTVITEHTHWEVALVFELETGT